MKIGKTVKDIMIRESLVVGNLAVKARLIRLNVFMITCFN